MIFILVSFVFFLLYMILVFLDIDKIYEQFKDTDKTIIFNSLILYFIIISKILLSIITVFILVLLFRILLKIIINIIIEKNEINIKQDVYNNIEIFFSSIKTIKFIIIFFILIPLVLFLFSFIYKYLFCNVKEQDTIDENTNKKIIYLLIISIIIICLIYLLYIYIKDYNLLLE